MKNDKIYIRFTNYLKTTKDHIPKAQKEVITKISKQYLLLETFLKTQRDIITNSSKTDLSFKDINKQTQMTIFEVIEDEIIASGERSLNKKMPADKYKVRLEKLHKRKFSLNSVATYLTKINNDLSINI